MASDNATVLGKSDKKSKSRRKKKIRRGRHGKAGTKAHVGICNILYANVNGSRSKGGFPVMAKITRILAANIPRQFFFVITTTASTRCLVQNFQLICYSQRVNATSQYNDSGSSRCSKWPKDRMVAVVKHCWLLVQGKEASEKDNQRQLLDRCSRKYWHVR